MHLLILRQVLGEQKFLVRFLPISFLKLVIHRLSRTFFVNTCRQVNGIPIRSPRIYRTVERSCTHGSCETLVNDVRAAFILHSRNKSFPRKLFRVMNIRDCLVSRSSILETRSSRLEIRVTRTSRREDRVETVNLPLSGTVSDLCTKRPGFLFHRELRLFLMSHACNIPELNLDLSHFK